MTEFIDGGAYEPVHVHFDDLDPMGILHHVRYGFLVERAMIATWLRKGWHPDPNRSAFEDVARATKTITLNYHLPITSPGKYVVHWWVNRLGTSSDESGFRVLSADRATVYADGTKVHVTLDPATGRPKPFSHKMRAEAEKLLVHPEHPDNRHSRGGVG